MSPLLSHLNVFRVQFDEDGLSAKLGGDEADGAAAAEWVKDGAGDGRENWADGALVWSAAYAGVAIAA